MGHEQGRGRSALDREPSLWPWVGWTRGRVRRQRGQGGCQARTQEEEDKQDRERQGQEGQSLGTSSGGEGEFSGLPSPGPLPLSVLCSHISPRRPRHAGGLGDHLPGLTHTYLFLVPPLLLRTFSAYCPGWVRCPQPHPGNALHSSTWHPHRSCWGLHPFSQSPPRRACITLSSSLCTAWPRPPASFAKGVNEGQPGGVLGPPHPHLGRPACTQPVPPPAH